jgi:hypothetical protein
VETRHVTIKTIGGPSHPDSLLPKISQADPSAFLMVVGLICATKICQRDLVATDLGAAVS